MINHKDVTPIRKARLTRDGPIHWWVGNCPECGALQYITKSQFDFVCWKRCGTFLIDWSVADDLRDDD